MSKQGLWYGIIIIVAVFLFFIVAGFFNVMQFATGDVKEVKSPVTEELDSPDYRRSEGKDSNNINILIMGDSIAKGTGDENAKGIGGYLPELLKNQTPKDIVVDNAAVDGYKSADLIEQIKSGRLDNAVRTADFVILSIGGNDIREIQSLRDVEKEEAFREKQKNYIEAVKEIIRSIRSKNKNAVIVSVGLYNPYGLEGPSDNSRLLGIWNYNTQLIIEEDMKAIFIPTYDLFKFNQEHFIASDKLHPSSAGYQTISYLISKAIERIVVQK